MILFPATWEFLRLVLHSFPAATADSVGNGSNLDSEKTEGLLEGLVDREVRRTSAQTTSHATRTPISYSD